MVYKVMRRAVTSHLAVFFFVLLIAFWGYSYRHSLSFHWQSRQNGGNLSVDREAFLSISRGVAVPQIHIVREAVGLVQPGTYTHFDYSVGRAFDTSAPHLIGKILGLDASVWTSHRPGQSIYNFDFWLPGWLLLIPLGVIAWKVRRSVVRRRRKKLGQCVACGYDLRASSGRCPECGAAIPNAVAGWLRIRPAPATVRGPGRVGVECVAGNGGPRDAIILMFPDLPHVPPAFGEPQTATCDPAAPKAIHRPE